VEDKFHTDSNAPWRLPGDALTQTHAYSQEHLVLIGLSHGFFGVLITVKVPSQRKYIIKQRSLFQDYLLVKKEPKYVMFETSKASDSKNSSTHGKPDAWLLEVLYAHMHAKNLCTQWTVKNTMLQEDTSRKALAFFFLCQRQGEVLPGHLGKGVALLTGTVLNPIQKNQRHTH
jgi:hypothetical protein